jgi:hypothetical protein
MSVRINTGSGSLADILGAEGFQYDSREWILVAKPLNTDFNLNFSLDENGLNFDWKEYDGIDIKTYRLKDLSTRNIFDVQTNSFKNIYYTGAQGYFEIFVVDAENNEHYWGRCFLNKNLPALRLGSINNQIALIWNKTPFTDNIAEYQIFKKDTFNGDWEKIATVPNSDTSFLIASPAIFAQRFSYYLYCVPKVYIYIDNTSSFSPMLQHVYTALPGPEFGSVTATDCSGFTFADYSSVIGEFILYRYDIATDNVKTLCVYNTGYDISPNAKYMLITGDSIVDLYDLKENSVAVSVNMKKIVNDYHWSLYSKISDNGICVFNTDTVIYVYDFIKQNLVAAHRADSYMLKVSSNGKYLSALSSDSIKMYRINESSLSFLSGMEVTGGMNLSGNYDFLPDQEDNFYFYQSSYMSVRSCLDCSEIRNMYVGPYFYNIDFCSDKIFTALDGNNWNIYDFNSGDLLYTLNSALGTGGEECTFLLNNTIFYSGYKYYLGN